jgi:hypothetical protein
MTDAVDDAWYNAQGKLSPEQARGMGIEIPTSEDVDTALAKRLQEKARQLSLSLEDTVPMPPPDPEAEYYNEPVTIPESERPSPEFVKGFSAAVDFIDNHPGPWGAGMVAARNERGRLEWAQRGQHEPL